MANVCGSQRYTLVDKRPHNTVVVNKLIVAISSRRVSQTVYRLLRVIDKRIKIELTSATNTFSFFDAIEGERIDFAIRLIGE